ncbi:hypothetical protein GOP47_0019401 [Adiantum capillus-veneris]|uniref:Uncharacterized protein n=1 Tax=Adiantum capillus-veneris TaxID=13818 RepID=A0A9D4Z9K8_ADICA|nr:hypothetical protein GOP47_0019401 [Adiantum capillus-veneris]
MDTTHIADEGSSVQLTAPSLNDHPLLNSEAMARMQAPPNSNEADICALQQIDDVDSQGLIRLYKLQGLAKKPSLSSSKKRRRWLCEQLGLIARCQRESNFLNLSKEEMQAIKRHNEILAMKKEAHFRNMFSSYITGIIGDEGIMKEMNELVAKHDHMLANKRMSLHHRWHEQVFRNVNEQVESKLKLLTPDQIKDKIRYFHYQYINASNQRLLFLDVIDNTFYNPFESLRYSIKYNSNFCDPLKHDLEKAKSEMLVKGERASRDARTRETLDASMWHHPKFRSTIWGHLNADDEDGSQVTVKNLEKWHSHDVLYNGKIDVSKPSDEAPLRGKRIVPNQGKGWSFREMHEGKGRVYGLPCMTQPKLQLYYT